MTRDEAIGVANRVNSDHRDLRTATIYRNNMLAGDYGVETSFGDRWDELTDVPEEYR